MSKLYRVVGQDKKERKEKGDENESLLTGKGSSDEDEEYFLDEDKNQGFFMKLLGKGIKIYYGFFLFAFIALAIYGIGLGFQINVSNTGLIVASCAISLPLAAFIIYKIYSSEFKNKTK